MCSQYYGSEPEALLRSLRSFYAQLFIFRGTKKVVLKFVQSIHLILFERMIPISIAYPAIRPHPGRKIQVLTIHVHFAVLKTLGAQVEAGGGGSVGPHRGETGQEKSIGRVFRGI